MPPAPSVAACRVALRRALAGVRAGPVLVACSGGPDSLALAATALWTGPRDGRPVGVLSVDHGLQPGSAERADAVAGWARAGGADPALAARVSVVPAGDGPEAAARRVRYAALKAAAREHGAVAVLLGHTLDDQAETVLLRLARGSGARSLAGMPAARPPFLRPFLRLRRAQTAGACAALGLEPWHDPHNDDPAYTRARVRARALPALEDALGGRVAPALARTADQLRDDDDALAGWARRAHREAAGPGGLAVPVLAALPVAVRRRVLRIEALAAGCPAGALSAGHLAALDALVADWHGQGPVALPSGATAARRCGFVEVKAAGTGGPAHRKG